MSLSSFVCTQLNSFKYCYLTLIILFNANHLFAHSLNGSKYCYLILGIGLISRVFANSLGDWVYTWYANIG